MTGTELDGRIALVTGASRGIGAAIAFSLAMAGAKVGVNYNTSRESAEKVIEKITQGGGEAFLVEGNVSEEASAESAVKQLISQCGQIDILVNNAGINFPEPFVDVSEDHYDQIMTLNVKAAFLVSQAVARVMISSKGGAILNVSSQMGHVGAANRTVYCASKHALEGLTKAMAVELAPHAIRVNSIGPTFILTPLTRPFFDNAEFRDNTLQRIPMGKLGELEDIMGAVVFLSSPASALITGAALAIDGGWTAW